ncbi:MAG TPA: diacylglycerol kinase family protein [Solirubrobacteraceae bacterium]|nr:diacylglycerol kinase family protein [Solirubrobacteraceae bacterium]
MAQGLLLVVNPAASRVNARVLDTVVAALDERFAVSVMRTGAAEDVTRACHDAAAAGREAVAVLGGDGTVGAAAAGLLGSSTALAPLPGGMTSVFCRTLGLPRDAARAARTLVACGLRAHRRVDMGTLDGRPFLFTAGIGATAELMERVERRPAAKRLLGQSAFALAGASLLTERRRPRLPPFTVEADGRRIEGVTAIVQNSSPLTYLGPRAVDVCAGAGLTTGTISLTLARRAGVCDVGGVLRRLPTGSPRRMLAHPQVEGFVGVRSAMLRALEDGPFAVELDGSYAGRFVAAELGVAPGALLVTA